MLYVIRGTDGEGESCIISIHEDRKTAYNEVNKIRNNWLAYGEEYGIQGYAKGKAEAIHVVELKDGFGSYSVD